MCLDSTTPELLSRGAFIPRLREASRSLLLIISNALNLHSCFSDFTSTPEFL